MNREEKLKKIESLKKQASDIKKEVDYYNALQLALKLVLNGSYGAFATSYFILYNNHVAGTITAQGRDLTKTMDKVNEDYWYKQWHNDFELHHSVGVKNVTPVTKDEPVSIYADTDSLFVSFKPAMDHCEWKHAYKTELDFIHDLDKQRYAGYFKKCLEEFADKRVTFDAEDATLLRVAVGATCLTDPLPFKSEAKG
mgnify:CR=1 FL=1